MFTGIDFSFSRVPPAVCAAAGHRFAVSYLTDLDTSHAAKAWTLAEVQAYRAAGLGVVGVWQGGGSDRTTAWRGGYDRGVRDARRAAQQAGVLGRPEGSSGRPVYFAVDFDVQASELATAGRYFDGIANVFDLANIGIYGGRRVIEWAMQSGKAKWFWQTGAWSGGVRVPGIHLFQRTPPVKIGAYDVDIDEALAPDYGQWFDAPGGGMSWCPFATRMELQPESDAQAAIRPTQLIMHSIAAPWTNKRIYEYWDQSTNLESHFGGSYDGGLAQFIGTQTRADANAQANRRADGTGAVSIETASNLQHTDPWTDAQIQTLIRLGVWLHQEHGIPLRICRSWTDPGFGYHRMFPEWSVGGTACPGDARVKQFREVVFPGIVRAASAGPVPSVPPVPGPIPVEEDMPVIHGPVTPGYDDDKTITPIVPPTVPDGKRAFLNVVGGYQPVLVRADGWVGDKFVFLGEGFAGGKSGAPAFFELPKGTRSIHLKRVKPEDAIPELKATADAIASEIFPDTPAAWNVEVV